MAADQAYLIYEYNLKIKDMGMREVGEVGYNNFDEYEIYLDSELVVNDKKEETSTNSKIEKISENEFRYIEIISIANIKENELKVEHKLNWLSVSGSESNKFNINIEQNIICDINLNNKEKKILSETKLSNGSTLYIEEVKNSKFENYVLARIVTKPIIVKDINSNTNEFMIEDPQFAICDQNDKTINHTYVRLEEFYEKVLDNGSIEKCDLDSLEDTDLVRMQQVQLIRLGFEDEEKPEKLKVLPLNRKLYNDRNDSEEKFYKNEDWYQVKDGNINITEDSTIGGSVTITRLEQTNDKIIFYYEKSGYVPAYIDFALRVKSNQMNYMYPKNEELKNIEGDENKIIYSKETFGHSGAPLLNYDRFDNLDELEFAMFYNVKFDVLSDALEFKWSKDENTDVATIKNIRFEKFIYDINDKLNY